MSRAIPVDKAMQMIDDADVILQRYDTTVNVEIPPDDTTTDNRFVIRNTRGEIHGVLAGNVFSRDEVLADLVRGSALAGRIGQVVADCIKEYKRTKSMLAAVEGRLYTKYNKLAHVKVKKEKTKSDDGEVTETIIWPNEDVQRVQEAIGVDTPSSKAVKDVIMSFVLNDSEYIGAIKEQAQSEHLMNRATQAQESLHDLENALKKALDYGEKSQ